MPEEYVTIPKTIVRKGGSVASGANNAGEELTVIDASEYDFVLQAASVMVIEDEPQEKLIVTMAVKSPNPATPPIPPTLVSTLHIALVQSGPLQENGAGTYVGTVQGPLPLKRGEQLVFHVQRLVGPGTFSFHAHAWGFAL